jgi:hypothetical protein
MWSKDRDPSPPLTATIRPVSLATALRTRATLRNPAPGVAMILAAAPDKPGTELVSVALPPVS